MRRLRLIRAGPPRARPPFPLEKEKEEGGARLTVTPTARISTLSSPVVLGGRPSPPGKEEEAVAVAEGVGTATWTDLLVSNTARTLMPCSPVVPGGPRLVVPPALRWPAETEAGTVSPPAQSCRQRGSPPRSPTPQRYAPQRPLRSPRGQGRPGPTTLIGAAEAAAGAGAGGCVTRPTRLAGRPTSGTSKTTKTTQPSA